MTNDAQSDNSHKIRLLIADDHMLMRNALRNLLSNQADFEIVAEAKNGMETIEYALSIIPDIIIMDISMPVLNGIEATQKIKTQCPKIGILVLTIHNDIEHVMSIMQAGADGFLTKTSSEEEIIQAVRSCFAGDIVLAPEISRNIFRYGYKYFNKPVDFDLIEKLSAKELEIIKLVAKGKPNKDIASDLNLTIRSVKAYLSIIFLKLNAVSRTEAISICLRSGILTVADLD